MMLTEKGQISIDFLMGLVIFLFVLGFIIQFIPSLFISTSSEGSLDSVAYRTANLLVEDPGWWENSTHNGTDWEIHTGNISRIGLAQDATPNFRRTDTPNILNKLKIEQVLKLNETLLTKNLGLYDKIGGSQIDYGYNITIEQSGSIMSINGSAAAFGNTPPSSADRFKVTRLVIVETGKIANFSADEMTNEPPLSNNKTLINITGPLSEDVIIQITNFNVSNISAQYNYAKLNGSKLTSNHTIYKKTNTSEFSDVTPPPSVELNETDTLRFILDYSLFSTNATYQLEFKFDNISFTRLGPPYLEYESKAELLYEPADLVVSVWK
jgi:hypothetical protein